MKEIGEKLKEAREAMGISTVEAAEDLKVEVLQIENLENGSMEEFKDVYYLKYLIRDYSKYLGLDKEDLVGEFNEYLFDYTSKISLEDIRKAKEKEQEDKTEDKIKSPYTIDYKRKPIITRFIIYAVVIVVLILVLLFVVKEFTKKDDKNSGTIASVYITK